MDVHFDTKYDVDHCNDVEDENEKSSPGKNDGHKILKDVVAYVDVWSAKENMSRVFQRELERLGATVVKRYSSRVTHVIFKEGNHATMLKAQKSGVHFLSVLWVDSCKQKKEHVTEKDFPACTPKDVNPLFAKRKRGKMMLPCDYEEDLARNAKRVARKQKKLDAINRLKSVNSSYSTPTSSPIAAILVHDTQPRSPDSGYRLTPIRLAIPETPPSMREKMRQLRLAKEVAAATASISDDMDKDVEKDLDAEMRQESLKGLQRALFTGSKELSLETSPTSSIEYSPVFHPVSSDKTGGNTSDTADTSITDDILKIAENINTTLNQDSCQIRERMFGVDSDENLLSSQEIDHITNGGNVQKRSEDDIQEAGSVPENRRGKNPEVAKRESTVAKSRRGTRRLSVQQALEELNKTVNVVKDHVKELDENPIPPKPSDTDTGTGSALSHAPSTGVTPELGTCNNAEPETSGSKSSSNSVLKDAVLKETEKECDETVGSSHDNSGTARKRKSCGKSLSQDNKEEGSKRRRSRASIAPVINDEEKDNGDVGEKVEQSEKVVKSQKPKRTVKKKLMSLTDLNDQHSVLVEPTKYSDHTDKAVLVDTSMSKRGRKKKQTTKESERLGNVEKSKETENEVAVASEEVPTNDKNRTSRKKTAAKGRKRKCDNKENVSLEAAASLADDTHTELEPSTPLVTDNTARTDSSHLHDNTTQLNLTKDSSVSMDLRETTLSMSMSRAYPDSTLPSILSNRKSIDEFSISQRRKQRRQRQMKRFLSSVAESDSVSTDSDNSTESCRGRLRGNTSQMETSAVRKNMRPSVVMTSLHSHEQDVVISVVKKLGGFVIAELVNETTTHVICGEPRRTLNILQCLARGAWLLSKEWVLKSLEAGSWVTEGEFECSDLFPTSKIARLEREKSCGLYRQTIFMGLGHVYVSGRSAPPRQHLVQLIKLCGGQVTGSKEKANVYVGSDFHPGLTCLKTNWVLDCISEHQLLPMDKYMLDRPKRESSPAY